MRIYGERYRSVSRRSRARRLSPYDCFIEALLFTIVTMDSLTLRDASTVQLIARGAGRAGPVRAWSAARSPDEILPPSACSDQTLPFTIVIPAVV